MCICAFGTHRLRHYLLFTHSRYSCTVGARIFFSRVELRIDLWVYQRVFISDNLRSLLFHFWIGHFQNSFTLSGYLIQYTEYNAFIECCPLYFSHSLKLLYDWKLALWYRYDWNELCRENWIHVSHSSLLRAWNHNIEHSNHWIVQRMFTSIWAKNIGL